jgi:hypothetical protein
MEGNLAAKPGTVLFLTCNDVKMAKRYFQTKASWLTAITLNTHDKPRVGNKMATPRAAGLVRKYS